MSNIQLIRNLNKKSKYYVETDLEKDYFNFNYEKSINYAVKTEKLSSENLFGFSSKTEFKIPVVKGDFLSKLYLKINLPALPQPSGFEKYLSWTNSICHTLIKKAILKFGNETIVEIPGISMEIISELFQESNSLNNGYNNLIGRSDLYTTIPYNAIEEHTYYLPLNFWFTKDFFKALPIKLLQNTDIKVIIEFNDLENCIVYNSNSLPDYQNVQISGELYADYILTDNDYMEHFLMQYGTRFIRSSTDCSKIMMNTNEKTKKMLIEQYQLLDIDISENLTSQTISLDFLKNDVKQLFLVCVDLNSQNNNDHFNFSRSSDSKNFIEYIGINVDGSNIIYDETDSEYFRLVNSHKNNQNIPLKYIYSIPFCKKFNKLDPSGSIPTDQFSNISLKLKFKQGNPEFKLIIIGVSYNILLLKSGFSSLLFK